MHFTESRNITEHLVGSATLVVSRTYVRDTICNFLGTSSGFEPFRICPEIDHICKLFSPFSRAYAAACDNYRNLILIWPLTLDFCYSRLGGSGLLTFYKKYVIIKG